MTTKKQLPIDRYRRISFDKENDEKGVDRQLKLIDDRLKSMKLPLGEVITDNDVSATSGVRRPGYERVCERIRNGESGGVAVYHTKRLLRLPREMEDFIDLVQETKAKVFTIASGDLDLTTATGRAMARTHAAWGKMESEEISERMKARFRQDAESGKVRKRGARPFGYNDDHRTLNKREAKAYASIFQLAIDGMGLSAISRHLAERGFLGRKDKPFSAEAISKLIRSPRAVGRVTYRGEILGKGDWEPIVSEKTQLAAIAALESRRQRHLFGTTEKRKPRLLSSLIFCAKCGAQMTVRKSGGDVYYRCNAPDHPRPDGAGTGGSMIRCELADDEVEKRFLALLSAPKTHAKLEKLRRQAPDVSALLEEIETLQHEIDAAAEDLGKGRIKRAQWLAIHDGTTERLDAARTRLDAAGAGPASLAMTPAQTVKTWDRLTLDEKRRKLGPWISAVKIEPLNGSGGRTFKPERLKVEWRI